MQAGLSLCWSHIPHCWKSHAAAHLLFVIAPIACGGGWFGSLFCDVVLIVFSSFAITRRRQLVAAILKLCSFSCVTVSTRGAVGLGSVIGAFPGHSHSFFLIVCAQGLSIPTE